ncbi:MAG: 3-oxoacyl-[acyl-carrier-protein] synthase 3 [Phycisphaerae bacterium]|nr:3-oxoacyl-[acyl-carrier-protein] synthase 3 [Phycisphaerae bacterium]
MKLALPVEILGTGAAVPARVVTNADFAAYLDTNDEWIVTRTGIRERRHASEGESTIQFAVAAARLALERARVDASELDLIICATVTPEYHLPATACLIQAAIGARQVPAYDLSASCAGFIYAFTAASQAIMGGTARTALVVGVDVLSRFTEFQDRGTAIIFGDGGGAVVLRRSESDGPRVLSINTGADGNHARLIWVPAGGTKDPASPRTVNERLHAIRMNGREVYKIAVVRLQQLIQQALDDGGVTIDQIKLLVPHQSNLRIIESVCEKLKLPLERVVVNINRYGNTSAGSIPLALHEALLAGRCGPGDLVLMAAIGAGLAWGSVLLRL